MKKVAMSLVGLIGMTVTGMTFAALSAVNNISLISKDAVTTTTTLKNGTPSNVTLNNITLSWGSVSGATKYIVHYGTQSVQASGSTAKTYDMESDPVSDTFITIKSLTGGTYYFAVTPVAANGEEGDTLSKELQVVVGSGVTINAPAMNFALSDVKVQDDRNIVLSFTRPLAIGSASISVKKTTDNSSLTVLSANVSKIDPTKLEVKLDTPLSDATSYQALVKSIKGAQGETITQGNSSFRDFTTPPSIPDSIETLALVSTPKAPTSSGVMTIKTGSITATGSMSGVLNSAPVLPQTGAKETLLLIVALIVGLAIASGMHFRKKA